MKRRLNVLLVGLLVIGWWGIRPEPIAAEEAAATALCPAETPVPNPWTRGNSEGWWMQWHERLLAAPERKEAQIVIIGDSISAAWFAAGEQFAPYKVLNLGINCDSTQHVLWRIDHGELDNLPKLKVAVIEIGTNNQGINRHPPEDIAKGVEAVCERVKQKAPQAKIILMAIFPKRFGAIKHEVANGLLAKLADDKQVFFVDINDKILNTEGAVADFVGHPTAKGYELWADEIRPLIEKLMKD